MTSISFRAFSLAAAIAATAVPGAAWAQWAWIDSNGTRQYSDTPPPPSVPQHRILKQPSGTAGSPITAPSSEDPAATPSKPEAMTAAEKNAEFLKRRQERLEKEKKAEEQQQVAAEKVRNCGIARENLQALESGVQITAVRSNGERYQLSEQEKAEEAQRTRRLLQQCEN